MGVCNKCGRTISRHLGALCMRCRYINKRAGAPSIVAKIQPRGTKTREVKTRSCAQCGKEIPINGGRVWCDYCAKYRRKICVECGKEFETSVTNAIYRDLCYSCKPRKHYGRLKVEEKKITPKQKAEKMRKIRASGLTYGQYMAALKNGAPIIVESNNEPPTKEETPKVTDCKPGEYKKPKVLSPPKIRIKIPISKLPCRGEPTRDHHEPRRQCAAWNL